MLGELDLRCGHAASSPNRPIEEDRHDTTISFFFLVPYILLAPRAIHGTEKGMKTKRTAFFGGVDENQRLGRYGIVRCRSRKKSQ